MKSFKEFVSESSLGQVWAHCKTDDEFAMITAFRGEFARIIGANVQRNYELSTLIRQQHYGFFWLDGHWIENKGTALEYDSSERTLFVIAPKNPHDPKAFLGHIKYWIKKYNQDAAIYKPVGTDMVSLVFKDGSMEAVGKFTPNRIAQAYSRLRNGKTFVFESVHVPLSFMTGLVREVRKKHLT